MALGGLSALHHAAVALSELYDDLLADRLGRDLGVRWGWRWRGPRRTAALEIDGIQDPLLGEFSTRSRRIEDATRGLVAQFRATHGHAPNRAEVLRLRQRAGFFMSRADANDHEGSTDGRTPHRDDALTAAGCDRIFVDKAPGRLESRPELDRMLEQLRPGDTVVVWRLDRRAARCAT